MPDLHVRFEAIDLIPVPEGLWAAVEDELATTGGTRPRPRVVTLPGAPAGRTHPTVRRTLIIAAALAIAVVPIWLAQRAFRSSDGRVQVPGAIRHGDEVLVVRRGVLEAVDPSTGVARVLVDPRLGGSRVETAAWSPDGTRVTYLATGQDGRPDRIYVLDRTGLRLVGGDRTYGDASGSAGVWSPDGTRLAAFVPEGDVADLAVADAADPEAVRIVARIPRGWGTDGPVWSADGRRIAYVTYAPGAAEIHLIAPDGASVATLDGSSPSWQPGGERLAFLGPNGIEVANEDGSDVATIGDGTVFAWSPDGTRVAYARVADELAPGSQVGFRDLWVVGADGSDAARVWEATGGQAIVAGPVWSPDGASVGFLDAYQRSLSGTTWHLVPTDGSGVDLPVERLPRASEFRVLAWSPCRCSVVSDPVGRNH